MSGEPSAATTSAAPCRSAAFPRSGYAYQRREVESTTLYQVVQGHIETFYQAVQDGFASAPLPNFVKQEFERFLDCGVLCRGAALLICENCPETKVIALSCKGIKQRRSGWRPWAELLKRSFDIDLRCPRCNATMKLKSFLTNPKSLQRLLTQLGEPTELQGKAPARAPPYFASKMVRRHFGEHARQVGMFD